MAKLRWNLITTSSLQTKVASSKYIDPLISMDWLRQTSQNKSGISNIWKAVLKSLSLIRDGIRWRINDDTYVHVGVEPWIGCRNAHLLPVGLIEHLKEIGITHTLLTRRDLPSSTSEFFPQLAHTSSLAPSLEGIHIGSY